MKLACQQEQHNPKQPKVKFIPRWRLEKNNTVCTKNKEILIYVDDVTSQDCPSLRKKQCFKKIFLTVISLSLKVQWWKAYPLSPILKWGLKTSQKKKSLKFSCQWMMATKIHHTTRKLFASMFSKRILLFKWKKSITLWLPNNPNNCFKILNSLNVLLLWSP